MNCSRLCRLTPICAALYVCIFTVYAMGQGTPVRLDSSDWWSYTRREELPVVQHRQPITFQSRKPVETNFQIAGITLGATWDFSEVRSKFGEATEVERGDAASGRNQICYESSSDDVFLIFELGEIDAVLYLFEDGCRNGMEMSFAGLPEQYRRKVRLRAG